MTFKYFFFNFYFSLIQLKLGIGNRVNYKWEEANMAIESQVPVDASDKVYYFITPNCQ